MLRDLLNFKKALGSRAVGGEVYFEWLGDFCQSSDSGNHAQEGVCSLPGAPDAGTAGPLSLTGPKCVHPGPRRGTCGFEMTADVGSCSEGLQRRKRGWPRSQLVPLRWASGRTLLCGHQ